MPKPYVTPTRETPRDVAVADPPAKAGQGETEAAASKPRKTRRKFTPAEKRRILDRADAAVAGGERGALEKLLRQEGIYSSHLAGWRASLAERGAAGLAPQKPGRKPKLDAKDRQLLAAQKEVAVLKRKLAVSEAVIELLKKCTKCLGWLFRI
jgi:transposase